MKHRWLKIPDDRKKYTDIDFEKRILNKKYLGEE